MVLKCARKRKPITSDRICRKFANTLIKHDIAYIYFSFTFRRYYIRIYRNRNKKEKKNNSLLPTADRIAVFDLFQDDGYDVF